MRPLLLLKLVLRVVRGWGVVLVAVEEGCQ